MQGSVLQTVGELVAGATTVLDGDLAPAVGAGDVAASNRAFDEADRLLGRVESATVVLARR